MPSKILTNRRKHSLLFIISIILQIN